MKRALAAIGLATALTCAAIGSSAHAQSPPPTEAYGRLPVIQDAAISPDGRRIALAVAQNDLTAFRLVNLDTNAIENTFGIPAEMTLRSVGWADDEHALYYVSQTFRPHETLPPGYRYRRSPGRYIEFWRVGAYSLRTRRQEYMMSESRQSIGQSTMTSLMAPIEGDPGFGRMIEYSSLDSTPRLTVFRVNLENGRGSPRTQGTTDTIHFLLDERGEAVARLDSDERTNRWQLHVYDGDRPRLLREDSSDTGAPLSVVGLLPDGRLGVVDYHEDGQRDVFFAIDRANGQSEDLLATGGGDVDRVISDPWSHRIVGVGWTENLPRQRFFDADLQAIAARVQAKFGDSFGTIVSWSRDKTRIIVFGELGNAAGVYFLYEPATDAMRAIGQTYPELTTDAALGLRQSITYRARDGTRIPAYLTLPAGVEPRGLPLVLLVHGGPHSRDNFTFDWWASFLASRGYAVLQPNYRGSTGYGYEYFNAGRGQWGDGVMQTDVEDGAAALIRSGMVDSARVCITGASYGGYAALAGATLTPARYACAVSVAGVSDVVRMLDETARQTGRQSMSSDWWRLSIGDPRAERERLRAISPANLAANVRAPILLVHGVEDTVVPISQSRLMADRLRGAGKNVRLVELRGDDHWLSSAATRTQMLREIETFLAEHIGRARSQ